MPGGHQLPPSSLTVALASEIRAEVGRLGWSQAELSRRTGILPSSMSDLIRGKKTMDLEQLALIATAIGVSPRELVGRAQAVVTQSLDGMKIPTRTGAVLDPTNPLLEAHIEGVRAGKTSRRRTSQDPARPAKAGNGSANQ